jgi:hypothetical protein
MKSISEYIDPKELRQIMENAERIGRMDVYWQAFERLCLLEGLQFNDPLDRDFHSMLAAYEELLTAKNRRRTTASRTRAKLRNKGVLRCLEDWALSKTQTAGFELLMANGLDHLTGEGLVLKYKERFAPHVVDAAKKRIERYHHNPEVVRLA